MIRRGKHEGREGVAQREGIRRFEKSSKNPASHRERERMRVSDLHVPVDTMTICTPAMQLAPNKREADRAAGRNS
jgi:hypothetical protein